MVNGEPQDEQLVGGVAEPEHLTVVPVATGRAGRLDFVAAVLRSAVLVAVCVSVVLVVRGPAQIRTVYLVTGFTALAAITFGTIRYHLLRTRTFQIFGVAAMSGAVVALIPASAELAPYIASIPEFAMAGALTAALRAGSRANHEATTPTGTAIEVGVVVASIGAWFLHALPPAWPRISGSVHLIGTSVLQPVSVLVVLIPCVLLVARLRSFRGPQMFVVGLGVDSVALTGNVAHAAAAPGAADGPVYLVVLILSLGLLAVAFLQPDLVELGTGEAAWRPRRSWQRTAWMFVVPSWVIGAVAIDASSFSEVAWPLLLLTSIGLLAIRARLVDGRSGNAARLRRGSEDGMERSALTVQELYTWCRSIPVMTTAGVEIAVLVVIPSVDLDGRGEQVGAVDAAVDSETVRRLREVMRGADRVDSEWSGDWEICVDRNRFFVVRVRQADPGLGPLRRLPSTRGADVHRTDEDRPASASMERAARSAARWLALPFRTELMAVRVEFGIGFAERRASGPPDPVGVMQDAVWAAQVSGSGEPSPFDPARRAAIRRRAQLGALLDDALDHGSGLSLVYEPIVDLRSGLTVGAEALARWDPPGWGAVGPTEFIPIAEAGPSILQLGTFVMSAACQAAAQAEHRQLVAVNVSGAELAHPDLYRRVMRTLADTGLEPALLTMEITERVVDESVARAADALRRLVSAGVKLSMDDFGTESSGLLRLLKLPWSSVKLDRSLVHGIESLDSPRATLIRSIVEVTGDLGATVVAEGVEDVETLFMVRNLGCQTAQGWVFGRGRADLAAAWNEHHPVGWDVRSPIPPQRRRPGAVQPAARFRTSG